MKTLNLPLAEVERQMTKEAGLLGLSGAGNDMRDVKAAAARGDARARLAVEVFIHSARHWIGAMLVELARFTPHPESVPVNALVRVEGTPLEALPPIEERIAALQNS